jgi:hypothetical protein
MAAAVVMGESRAVEYDESLDVTLWELVWAVSQVADNEREVIATVAHMLESGSVRLVGNFRDCPIRSDS